jgi:threonine dehydratase
MNNHKLTLALIKDAAKHIYTIVSKTPIISLHTASQQFNSRIYMKLENNQIVKSFKIRGAANKIMHLTKAQKAKGVICASAGNHAQGTAYSATKLGIKSVIVMPNTAPLSKIEATANFGGSVVLAPSPYFDDANKLSQELARKNDYILIPPYDDVQVMAGQGTIGLEIMEQLPNVDMVIVQIGGGGLIAGVATAIKSINPKVKVVGVQTENFPAMYDRFNNVKSSIPTLHAPGIADGIQVKEPSNYATQVVKKYVDKVITVTNEEVENAVTYLVENAKIITEGAGATGFAAILANKIDVKNKRVVTIASGGNIDIDRLIFTIEKTMNLTNRRLNIKIQYKNKNVFKFARILQSCGAKAYIRETDEL